MNFEWSVILTTTSYLNLKLCDLIVRINFRAIIPNRQTNHASMSWNFTKHFARFTLGKLRLAIRYKIILILSITITHSPLAQFPCNIPCTRGFIVDILESINWTHIISFYLSILNSRTNDL